MSYRHAAERLGVSRRQVERLVKAGRLTTTGCGHRRKVTVESLEEHAGKRNRDQTPDISQPMSGVIGYTKSMLKVIRTLPALSTPQSAARRLGVELSALEDLMRNEHVPTVAIGPQRFVPRHWLASVLARAYGIPIEL